MEKKKIPPHFFQDFGSRGIQSNSKIGQLTLRKDEHLQQPARAACRSHCAQWLWTTSSTAGETHLGSTQLGCVSAHSQDIQRSHLQQKICLDRAPQHWHQHLMLSHYLFRPWLGREPKPMSRFLGGIFSLSWKRVFCSVAQICLQKLQSLSKGLFLTPLEKAFKWLSGSLWLLQN